MLLKNLENQWMIGKNGRIQFLFSGISQFVGNFSVPDKPQNDPEELYIFTGLQNVDWIPIVDPEPPVFDIIQVRLSKSVL